MDGVQKDSLLARMQLDFSGCMTARVMDYSGKAVPDTTCCATIKPKFVAYQTQVINPLTGEMPSTAGDASGSFYGTSASFNGTQGGSGAFTGAMGPKQVPGIYSIAFQPCNLPQRHIVCRFDARSGECAVQPE